MEEKLFVLNFLKNLSNNNSKEWMDANRSDYQKAKGIWLNIISNILKQLSKHDEQFNLVEPKDTIFRINNNRRFQPDKPIYKDFFSCSPNGKLKLKSMLYISIGVSESFIGGGLWRPEKETLEKVRAGIDYDGEKLKAIVESKDFVDFYGGLGHDDQKLKSAPQNYDKDNPNIELLRFKNLVAIKPLTEDDFLSDNFIKLVEEAYLKLKPFSDYLYQAMSVEN